ncbi:MAG TPA: flagellar motor protein MotA, partial [Candidatus Marinimicrobia bacterium]|nr:flagellar motor protein MotA [Candidatus Neomarinimicrobiota bacterium]
MLVEYFVNGGPFMWPILISLVFGLAFAGERFYSLIMSSINAEKFFKDVHSSLDNDGIDST